MEDGAIKIDLTDSEWMSLIDKESEGLPPCCSSVSDLRDVIICAASEGRMIPSYLIEETKDTIQLFQAGHDANNLPVLAKFIEQVTSNESYLSRDC